jgi:predicted outer membrane repeat protein
MTSHYSTFTATDCTMNSNSAVEGGSVTAQGDSVVSVANCTIASNSASLGGAAMMTSHYSIVTATDCTMSSNSASVGGAIHTEGTSSTVTMTGCLIAANLADLGGALSMRGGFTATVIDCTMTENSAFSGGAIYVGVAQGEDVSYDDEVILGVLSKLTVVGCNMEGNRADDEVPSGLRFFAL